MQLDYIDDTLFDIDEDMSLDSCMAVDPMLVSQCMPSEKDLRVIEAQAMRMQTEAYFKDRRTSLRLVFK